MNTLKKIKSVFTYLFIWINRLLFFFLLVISVILILIFPKWHEEITLSNGLKYTQHLHEGDLEMYNFMSFIPILFLVIISFLERKNKKIRYLLLLLTFLTFCWWYIWRIYLRHPNYNVNYFTHLF